MSEDKYISIFGDLSKPANTLIEKISSAVGGICEPWQMKRVAKGKADANLIKTQSDIYNNELNRRARKRFFDEEAKRQDNMEKITKKACTRLKDSSDPSKIEDDWVTNFFDKSRIVSNDDMQEIWAKVLAGEANVPGTFSKRTVNFLGELDKKEAELFQNICSFCWIIRRNLTPLIFNVEAPIYNNKGINFTTLTHLDSIGLIKFNSLGYIKTKLPESLVASYYNQPLLLEIPNYYREKYELPIGKVILTKIGKDLFSVCKAPSIEGFFDYVKQHWEWERVIPRPKESEQDSGCDA